MFIQPSNVLKSFRLFTISNLEHSHLIDCMRQLHPGALCVGIYKWAQSDKNDKKSKFNSSLRGTYYVRPVWVFCLHTVPKATMTQCDLSRRFVCNDATLLCEFESDKI